MARTKSAAANNPVVDHGSVRTGPWSNTHGTFISGQAFIDEADKLAVEVETRWGAGRVRLLVDAELRTKFDRQRYLFNQAIWHGDLEQLRREAGRMAAAWRALDRAAAASDHQPLDPQVWEVALENGTVAAIVPDYDHAAKVAADGRRVAVYSLEEVGRLLSAYPGIVVAKVVFPGAEVTQIRRTIDDPLNAIHDTSAPLNDSLDHI